MGEASSMCSQLKDGRGGGGFRMTWQSSDDDDDDGSSASESQQTQRPLRDRLALGWPATRPSWRRSSIFCGKLSSRPGGVKMPFHSPALRLTFDPQLHMFPSRHEQKKKIDKGNWGSCWGLFWLVWLTSGAWISTKVLHLNVVNFPLSQKFLSRRRSMMLLIWRLKMLSEWENLKVATVCSLLLQEYGNHSSTD